MKTIEQALLAYEAEHGGYPEGDSLDALEALTPVFLPSFPRTNPLGEPYAYRSDGKTFELRSSGPDRVFQTEDDVSVSR